MPAHVVQCADPTVLSAHDDEGLAADVDGEEIAGLAHLALVSGAMPVAQEQPLHLALKQVHIAVELAAERVPWTLGRDRLRTAIGSPLSGCRARNAARLH